MDSKEVSEYIQKAKGFIQAGIEGFGIAPIEAQSCGTPVVAFAKGGVLETVVNNKTGIFFNEQTEDSLINAINQFEKTTFNPLVVRQNAFQFSLERFEKEMQSFVEIKWAEHLKQHI